ncbi:MAG: hypothetical protein QOE05_3017 [Actinomycetota bacterium]|jgi:hypothetical protein|nr:hypothetical protein [Actinomycetota bacterium]
MSEATQLAPAPATDAYGSSLPPVTLAGLLDTLGAGLLRVAVAPQGLGIRLGPAQLYDSQDLAADYHGGLVLGIGIDAQRSDASVIVEAVAQQHAAALVLKSGDDLPPRLLQTAADVGLALVTIPTDASWDQVHVFLRTAMAASGSTRAGRDPEGTALGNLFRLADAIAAMVGGPTTIEDPDSVVLAYSSGDAPIDLPRQQTILGHRVPEDWVRKLHDAGVFKKLLSGDDVVSFEDPGSEIRPRLALAVRAGGELLGSIWVAEGPTPFTDSARQALREAGSIAALHLIQHRNLGDFERSRRSESLRGVLRGHLPAEVAAESLGITPQSSVTLAAFQLHGMAGPELALKSQRLVDLITLYCAAYRRNAGAVVIAETVYLLLAEHERQGNRMRALAEDLVDRARDSIKAPVRVGLSRTTSQISEVRELRQEADQALRVLTSSSRLGPVASIDELRSQAVLMDLRDFATRNPSVLEGKLRALIDEDDRRGTAYVHTLRAYLEHFGDIPSAAASLPVHTNTFRYRLRRLSEFASIDLDDADERLVLQIQLRLREGSGPSS